MKINRRQFLYGTTAVAVPLIGGCSGEEEYIVNINENFPVGPYGSSSTAEEVTLGLDLTGKTAVVTGCNSGLGLETMRVLSLRGAHVIGTGRTLEKASKACSTMPGKTTPMALELSSLKSVLAVSYTHLTLPTILRV